MRRLLVLLTLLSSFAHAQMAGKFTGQYGYQIPQVQSLTHAYQFSNSAAVTDLIGSYSFSGSGFVFDSAQGGWDKPSDYYMQRNSGYYAKPGTPFATQNSSGSLVSLASSSQLTLFDGTPHTLIYTFQINNNQIISNGSGYSQWTPLGKPNEYQLLVKTASTGSVTLNYGSGLTSSIVAPAWPSSSHAFQSGANVNSSYGWYMVRVTYDGVNNLCVSVNDAAQSCATVSVTTSASVLSVTAPVVSESLYFANTVLQGHNDTGATCVAAPGPTQCPADTIYNASLWNPYRFLSGWSGLTTTVNVNGSAYIADGEWGTTYQTYENPSNSVSGPFYYVPNPQATMTVTTNAPAVVLNVVGLNGATNLANNYAQIGTWLDGSYYQTLYAQQTGGQLITLALPGDGATHTLKFQAASYVGYSSNDTTPYSGMYTTVVKSISIGGSGYTLTPVTPTTPTATCLVMGDSIVAGSRANYFGTDGVWTQLRANSGGKCSNVVMDAIGGGALWHRIGCNPSAGNPLTCTSTAWTNGSVSNTHAYTPAAFADQLKTWYGCPAYFWEEMQVNDYGRGLWKASDAALAMGKFWAEWVADCPSTVNYQMSGLTAGGVTEPDTYGDYFWAYSLTGTAQTPSWQASLAGQCTGGVNCTNIDQSGRNSSGISDPNNFPIYGGGVYGNCAAVIGGPSLANAPNNAYYTDMLHPTSCGYQMLYLAIFHNLLGWF